MEESSKMINETQTFRFFLVNAFSGSTFGGNPAVVLLLDAPFADASLYLQVAKNFSQPISCFVFPTDNDDPELDGTTKAFGIRWFTVSKETAICGHGTLAAAHVLFAKPEMVPPEVKVLRFKAMHGYVSARRVQVDRAPDRIEIELPAFDAKPVEEERFARVRAIVGKAFGRDVDVKYVGVASGGEPGSEVYLLVELDEKEVLDGVTVDTSAFTANAPYSTNILTVKSQRPGIAYETRMFAPLSGVPEDHVCGSANCLMAPYWANKLSVASTGEMKAKQVSVRGGDLWVSVDHERRKVCLQGEARLTGTGQYYL